MVNEQHLNILEQGVNAWNDWREQNPQVWPDLTEANLSNKELRKVNFSRASLSKANLSFANITKADFTAAELSEADLSNVVADETIFKNANLPSVSFRWAKLNGANLTDANLFRADLSETILHNANLRGANLNQSLLIETNFENADLSGSKVFGISAWELKLNNAIQSDLVVSRHGSPTITVDNLEVAQFVYLLLKNEKIRDVINTIGKKGVLILGSFYPPERKSIIEAMGSELRRLNYLPIIFDFGRATNRDFTETIMTLAGMSLFVIADITKPKSVPLELQASVPNYMIPFVPIIQQGEQPFSMFSDLKTKFDWVLDLLEYDTVKNLIQGFEKAIIKPALQKYDELLIKKTQQLKVRHIEEYT